MKTCNTCNIEKNETDYYSNTKRCKECTRARVRANRLSNLEYYQNYDRNRPNKVERAIKQSEYAKTPRGKEVALKGMRNFRRDKVKYGAHCELNNALRDGKINKPSTCSNCNTDCNPHGHHDDYSKALDVRWLCTKCHTDFHNHVREKQRELEKQGLSDLFDSHKLIKNVAKTYWKIT